VPTLAGAPRRRGSWVVVAVVTALILIPRAGSAAASQTAPLDLRGMALPEAVTAIDDYHETQDPGDYEITLVPDELPDGVDDVRVVVAQYDRSNDDVGPQHFWTLDLGTPIPELSSLDREQARTTLRDLGFEMILIPDDADDDWVVTDSDPAAGVLTRFGEPVLVTLTEPGPQPVQVPDLIRTTQTEAGDLADAAGLELEVIFVDGDEADVGRVIRQDPSAGTEVEPGSLVQAYLVRAPETALVAVPDLTGSTETEASDILDAASLVIDIDYVDGSASRVGRVVDQDPLAGTEVEPGTTVHVSIVRVLAPPASQSGWWYVAGGVILLLLGLLAAATAIRARARRQRAWVRTRLSAHPRVGSARTVTNAAPGTGQSLTVRLVPHPDRGSQRISEVPQ
jgi:hypothetical protein